MQRPIIVFKCGIADEFYEGLLDYDFFVEKSYLYEPRNML